MPRLINLDALNKIVRFPKLPLIWLGQVFCRWCVHCCAYWQSLKPFYRHLTINMLIGLSITLLLVMVQDNRFLQEKEDMGIDWVMQMFRNTQPTQDTPPFVLLDIDEKTYQHWQEPLLTPRDKLLKLLKFAVGGQPKIIIVDIDLSYPTERFSKTLNSADQSLSNFLAQYEVHCSNTNCPHILLARTFQKSLEDNGYDYVVRDSFLNSVVAKSPHIHWASTSFDLSRDRILRRWRLWETACSEQLPVVVPSMQLLTVALLKNSTQGAEKLANELAAVIPVDCKGDKSWTTPTTHLSVSSNLQLNVSPSRLNRRIFYTIPWELREGESRPFTLQNRILLSTLSAYNITEREHVSSNTQLVQDTITIIGGSFKDSHDIHATPFGEMPGALVIANAIHSLLQFGELTPPPLWAIILVQALLIFLMSLTFALFSSSFYGMLFSGGVIIIVMIPFSFWLFEYGVWLNFAIALVIVQLNQMAAGYRKILQTDSTTD